MTRKLTRLEKSTKIVENSVTTKWCYVNTDNEFEFIGHTFIIDESVKQYKVHNKAGTVEDYTNEAYMEEILVSIDENGYFNFYDQNYDEVAKDSVRVKG